MGFGILYARKSNVAAKGAAFWLQDRVLPTSHEPLCVRAQVWGLKRYMILCKWG